MASVLSKRLQALGSCAEAIGWVEKYPDFKSAWRGCDRGEWLAWLAVRLNGVDGVRGAIECTKAVLAGSKGLDVAQAAVAAAEQRLAGKIDEHKIKVVAFDAMTAAMGAKQNGGLMLAGAYCAHAVAALDGARKDAQQKNDASRRKRLVLAANHAADAIISSYNVPIPPDFQKIVRSNVKEEAVLQAFADPNI